jgi:hypothetical protein
MENIFSLLLILAAFREQNALEIEHALNTGRRRFNADTRLDW